MEDLDALDDTKEGVNYENGGNKLGLNLEKKSARVKRRLLTRQTVEEAEGTRVYNRINGEMNLTLRNPNPKVLSFMVSTGRC